MVVDHKLSCSPACGIFLSLDPTCVPCIGRWIPNHWTPREVQRTFFKPWTRMFWGFPSGPVVNNPSAIQETWVPPVGREDPLQKEMTICSSTLAWRKSPALERSPALPRSAERRPSAAPLHLQESPGSEGRPGQNPARLRKTQLAVRLRLGRGGVPRRRRGLARPDGGRQGCRCKEVYRRVSGMR